ncbi:MFS transporter [Micromonospora pisi]|uniref:MFS transporter n=1 Tax=Micromonospora pisi TaxID=589240 RepID=A0A495JC64_9ACTN|nr:MFS transporter [Micromonospora pisi]RKR86098.1 MFS transporter [Micromonospora pisi]
MPDSSNALPVREVRDVYGRRYRVGETDFDLTGRSRIWMLRLCWASMLAISLFQYGFGAAIPALTRANGWTLWEAFSVLAVWIVCQAGTALPAVWLYRRVRVRLVVPMLAAASLSLVALITLGHSRDLATVLVGYSVLGGIGAGLVYMTCIATVTEWYPERTATMVGVVSGAFGYGAVPFVVIAAYVLGIENLPVVLDSTAVAVFVVIAVSGLVLRKPPRHWWPAQIDPQRWAVDRRLNRSIPNNMPALRPYSPRAAVRSGMLPLMFFLVVLTAAMALFDIAYLVGFAHHRVEQPLLIVASIGVLAVATGIGRAVTSSLSDRLGRRRTLGLALAVGGVAQFGLLAAVEAEQVLAVVAFAGLAGAGTGAGYSLLVSLVRDWFGGEATLFNYGIVYTGKVVGGLAGIGLAGLVTGAPGAIAAFVAAGCLGLFGALLTSGMRQPGRPTLSVLPRLRPDEL